MKRSSPVKVTASAGEPPAIDASAARYRPTGQPSVRPTSSRTSASPRSTPDRASSTAASVGSIARSSIPISSSPPCARRRAVGSGRASRELIASCEPAGSSRASAAIDVARLPVRDGLEMVDDERDRSLHGGDHRSHPTRHLDPGARCRQQRGTRPDRSARSDPLRRRRTTAGRRGRCRPRRQISNPPGRPCAPPTAPARSSCRSRVARRSR